MPASAGILFAFLRYLNIFQSGNKTFSPFRTSVFLRRTRPFRGLKYVNARKKRFQNKSNAAAYRCFKIPQAIFCSQKTHNRPITAKKTVQAFEQKKSGFRPNKVRSKTILRVLPIANESKPPQARPPRRRASVSTSDEAYA